MAEEFDRILSECLDRMVQGESLEQCLGRHPEQAAQLKPLLRIAQAAQKASSVKPRPEFKAQARNQMLSWLHSRKRKPERKGLPVLGWMPRWATAVIVGVFVLLLAGGSTVAASSNSLPGDILYPVKLATEKVQTAFTFSDTGKAKLDAKLASRRAEEMARLAERGDSKGVAALRSQFEAHLERVEDLAVKISEDKPASEPLLAELEQQLQNNAERDDALLQKVGAKAPEQFKLAIARAKERLNQAYEEALKAIHDSQNQNQDAAEP